MARPRRRARPASPTMKRSKPPPSAPSKPCAARLRPYAHVLTAPARAARETAQALGLDAEVEMALRDCDYGRWRGLASKDVAEREPDAFAAWLGDPAAAPHGGESLTALIERTGAWLAQSLARESATLAVTHASVVRAAIVNALGAGSSAFCSDRCRAALACQAQRSRRTLESCGARAFGRPVVRGLLVALVAALVMLGDIAEPGASDLHAQRAASARRLDTQPHAWPDGGDPRQSARDPGAGQRPDRVRHDDLAAGGLSEPSVLRLFLGARSRQHHGRGQSVQRMRPRLSRRGAGAPVAAAPRSPAPITKRSRR